MPVLHDIMQAMRFAQTRKASLEKGGEERSRKAEVVEMKNGLDMKI